MATNDRRVRRSRAQWQGLIERATRSPLSIGAFCRGQGVSTASFYNWRRRLGEVAPGTAVAEATGEDGAFIELGVLGGSAHPEEE